MCLTFSSSEHNRHLEGHILFPAVLLLLLLIHEFFTAISSEISQFSSNTEILAMASALRDNELVISSCRSVKTQVLGDKSTKLTQNQGFPSNQLLLPIFAFLIYLSTISLTQRRMIGILCTMNWKGCERKR